MIGAAPSNLTTPDMPANLAKVLDALHQLGEATAATVADAAGYGYSTVTPRLRKLESLGLAKTVRGDDGRTRWRSTQRAQPAATGQDTEPDSPLPDTGSDAATATVPDPEHRAVSEACEISDYSGRDTEQPDSPQATRGEIAPPDPTGVASPDASARPAAGKLALSVDESDPAPAGTAATAGSRRKSGSLAAAIIAVFHASPGQAFKVSDLCKHIDQANQAGAKKVSAGAVHNAAATLVNAGHAVLVTVRPATFAATTAAQDSQSRP